MVQVAAVSLKGAGTLSRKLRDFAKNNPRVFVPVVNRAAQRASTRTRRQVSSHNRLPQKVLKNRIKAFKATAKGGFFSKGTNRSAYVWLGLKKAFKVRDIPGAKVSAKTSTLKGGKHSAKVFLARMPNGYVGYFQRLPGSSHKKSGGYREGKDGQRTELPIGEPKIRIDQVHASRVMVAEVQQQLRQYVPKELERLYKAKIKRLSAKR